MTKHVQLCKKAREILDELIRRSERPGEFGVYGLQLGVRNGQLYFVKEQVEKTHQ